MIRTVKGAAQALSCLILVSSANPVLANETPRVSLVPVRCDGVDSLRLWSTWSPVGHRIAFRDRRGSIEVLDVDRSMPYPTHLLGVPRGAKVVDWSPDGERLLYVEKVGTGTWAGHEERLVAVSLQDGSAVTIADVPEAWPAFWASDGRVWWWDGSEWQSRRPFAGAHRAALAPAETLLVVVFDDERRTFRVQRFESPAGNAVDLELAGLRPSRANVHGSVAIVMGTPRHGLINRQGRDVTPLAWKRLPFTPYQIAPRAGLIYGTGSEDRPGANARRFAGDEEPEAIEQGFVGSSDGSWWQQAPPLVDPFAQLSPDGRFIAGEDSSRVLRVFELRVDERPTSTARHP